MQFLDREIGSLEAYERRYWWKLPRFITVLMILLAADVLRMLMWRFIPPTGYMVVVPLNWVISPYALVITWLAASTITRLRGSGIGEDLALTPITSSDLFRQVARPLLAFTLAVAAVSSLLMIPSGVAAGQSAGAVIFMFVTAIIGRILTAVALPMLCWRCTLSLSGSIGRGCVIAYSLYIVIEIVMSGLVSVFGVHYSNWRLAYAIVTTLVWIPITIICARRNARDINRLLAQLPS